MEYETIEEMIDLDKIKQISEKIWILSILDDINKLIKNKNEYDVKEELKIISMSCNIAIKQITQSGEKAIDAKEFFEKLGNILKEKDSITYSFYECVISVKLRSLERVKKEKQFIQIIEKQPGLSLEKKCEIANNINKMYDRVNKDLSQEKRNELKEEIENKLIECMNHYAKSCDEFYIKHLLDEINIFIENTLNEKYMSTDFQTKVKKK